MAATVFTAILSFISTNIDDIFVLMLFLVQETLPRRKRQILYGQYLGIGTLVLVSLLGARLLQLIPQSYIGFLGLIPVGLGIKEAVSGLRGQGEENTEIPSDTQARGVTFAVMFLAIAGGADNLGVYIPLFAGFSGGQKVIMLAVFAVMILVWYKLAEKIVSWPVLGNVLRRYRYLIVPVVFVGLGIYILAENFL